MGYEIFEKTVRRDTEPRVTISTLGRIQFNATASRILDKNVVETVLLLWDKDTRKIGIKSITKKDDRAYRMRYAKKGKGAGFAAKTFLIWINHDYSESKSYPCLWNEAELTFEIPLPAEISIEHASKSSIRASKSEIEAKRNARAAG
jgi:hypothetical protein